MMTAIAASIVPEDVEVSTTARRRRFTAKYKLEVLHKADAVGTAIWGAERVDGTLDSADDAARPAA
jgi:hypothetical protein